MIRARARARISRLQERRTRDIDCRRGASALPLLAPPPRRLCFSSSLSLHACCRPSGSQLTRVTRITADPTTHAAVTVAQPPSHCRPCARSLSLSLLPSPFSLLLPPLRALPFVNARLLSLSLHYSLLHYITHYYIRTVCASLSLKIEELIYRKRKENCFEENNWR